MVSIVSSYPGFHALPRGIKQMLLTSERHFFLEAKPAAPAPRRGNGVTHLAPPPKFEPLALPPEIQAQIDAVEDPTVEMPFIWETPGATPPGTGASARE